MNVQSLNMWDSIKSSADKHSYETVDKPILIMHTMTCIVPVFQ